MFHIPSFITLMFINQWCVNATLFKMLDTSPHVICRFHPIKENSYGWGVMLYHCVHCKQMWVIALELKIELETVQNVTTNDSNSNSFQLWYLLGFTTKILQTNGDNYQLYCFVWVTCTMTCETPLSIYWYTQYNVVRHSTLEYS